MGVFDQLVRLGLPWIPRKLIWIVARRFVAGSDLSDGLERVGDLRAAGFGTILDLLGEGQDGVAPAEAARTEYLRALEALPDVDPRTTISVKPTHLGLLHGEDLCERLLVELCEAAAEQGRRVRLEMESAETIDGTLAVFRRVRARHANLGCVLQSRLFRSAADVQQLLADGPGLDVRLVKGIYLEPPEIAWTDDADICRSYRELTEALAAGGAFLSLATHHTELADACLQILGRTGRLDGPVEHRRYEFQLLMGVRRDEAQRLLGAGHPVRIYVPYGQDWYAYTQRRLQANPQIARHVLRALLTGG
jgi:proline dehydrogenase